MPSCSSLGVQPSRGGGSTMLQMQHCLTTSRFNTWADLCMQWPGVQGLEEPPHAQLQLFGGAAFERCMSEFQAAVTSLSFPSGKPAPWQDPSQSPQSPSC